MHSPTLEPIEKTLAHSCVGPETDSIDDLVLSAPPESPSIHVEKASEAPPSGPSESRPFTDRMYTSVRHAVENVIAPAITNFLNLCNTNPRVAAVVATPLLIGCILTIAFFLICSFLLICWTVVEILIGTIVLVTASLISLSFKLILVTLCTFPMAATSIGLLIGANYAAERIVEARTKVDAMIASTDTDRLVRDALIVFNSTLSLLHSLKPVLDWVISFSASTGLTLWRIFIQRVDTFNNSLSALAENSEHPSHQPAPPAPYPTLRLEEIYPYPSNTAQPIIVDESIVPEHLTKHVDATTVIIDDSTGSEARSSGPNWFGQQQDMRKRQARDEIEHQGNDEHL